MPPPMIVMPAASIFARNARVASGGSVRGMWTSLNVMCFTPSVFAMSSAWSSVNSRIEHDARPVSAGQPAPAAAGAAPASAPGALWPEVHAAAATRQMPDERASRLSLGSHNNPSSVACSTIT